MGRSPKLLLVSPSIIDLSKMSADKRYKNSREKNLKLSESYRKIAERNGCFFVDLDNVITCSVDGVHFDKENHITVAQKLKSEILGIKWG